MPYTVLLAMTYESGNLICQNGPWWPAPWAWPCAQALASDDCDNGSRLSQPFPGNPPTRWGRFWYDRMPNEARGAAIDSLITDSTGHRGGGSVSGQYRVVGWSFPAYTLQVYQVWQPGRPGGPCGVRRNFMDITGFGAVGIGPPWTQPTIDGQLFGIFFGPNLGTGVSVSYFGLNCTWRGAAASRIAIGISWLGPLLAAGLGGLNLFHESAAFYEKFQIWMKDIVMVDKIKTMPALSIPEEKEILLNSLFVRPKYVFL